MNTQSDRISKVLRTLLSPVERFCLRHSVKVQEVVEGLKVALVDNAVAELESMGEKVNMSRLSVMTGLHRRDIKRIFHDRELRSFEDDFLNRIIGLWAHGRSYAGEDGSPRALSYSGEDSEFRELVASVSQDIDARSILFELERMGAIERQGDLVHLLFEAKLVRDDADAAYDLLARDINDLSRSVEQNVLNQDEIPNLHARTRYDNVMLEKLPEIRRWLLKRGSEFHRDVREYLSAYDLDLHPELKGQGGGEVIVGAFSRMEDDDNRAEVDI